MSKPTLSTVPEGYIYVASLYDTLNLDVGTCVRTTSDKTEPIDRGGDIFYKVTFDRLDIQEREIKPIELNNIPDRVDMRKPLIARRVQDNKKAIGSGKPKLYEYAVLAMLKNADRTYERAMYNMDRGYDQ